MSCENLTNVDEVGQDVLNESQYQRPVQDIINNPAIPYYGPVPFPLEAGQLIEIIGTVIQDAHRFAVDLMCGPNAEDDIAFHFNPRFDEKYVVRNSRIKDRWGEEEDSVPQKSPFKHGEEFYLVIFVAEEQFMVSVNARHFCNFSYRVLLECISDINISGDLLVTKIHHRKADIYPEVSSQRTHLYNTIDLTTPEVDEKHLLEAPYIGTLTEPLSVGKELEFFGRVKQLPQSFYFNLQCGQQNWPHPIIFLHVNPHFLMRSNSVSRVVCNSWITQKWGPEELIKQLPFNPGETFLLSIRCEQDHFAVTVDGELLVNYKHRLSPDRLIDTVVIDGDVWIRSLVAS